MASDDDRKETEASRRRRRAESTPRRVERAGWGGTARPWCPATALERGWWSPLRMRDEAGDARRSRHLTSRPPITSHGSGCETALGHAASQVLGSARVLLGRRRSGPSGVDGWTSPGRHGAEPTTNASGTPDRHCAAPQGHVDPPMAIQADPRDVSRAHLHPTPSRSIRECRSRRQRGLQDEAQLLARLSTATRSTTRAREPTALAVFAYDNLCRALCTRISTRSCRVGLRVLVVIARPLAMLDAGLLILLPGPSSLPVGGGAYW